MCKNAAEAALVVAHLPEHITLTRAEPGCISFVVEQTDGPLVWTVDERFTNPDAFHTHQARAAASAWGRVTSEIARDYTVIGLSA